MANTDDLVLGSLARGDVGAAARALISPESLLPSERTTLAEQIAPGPPESRSSILDTVIGLADPLLAISLLLSWKFPVPKALRVVKDEVTGKHLPENWFAVSKRFDAMKSELTEPLWQRLSPGSLFAGTKVLDHLVSVSNDRVGWLNKYLHGIGGAIAKYEQRTGRSMRQEEMVLAGAALEKLHERAPYGYSDRFSRAGLKPVFDSLPNDKHFTAMVKEFEALNKEAHRELAGDPVFREKMAKALNLQDKVAWKGEIKRLRGMGLAEQADRLAQNKPSQHTAESVFKEIEYYLPHYGVFQSGMQRGVFLSEIGEAYGGTFQGLAAEDARKVKDKVFRMMTANVTRSARLRQGGMLPSIPQLEMPGVRERVNPETLAWMKEHIASRSKAQARGYEPVENLEYSLHYADAMRTYHHMAASTYAWTVKGAGDAMLETALEIRKKDPVRYKVLMETYVPLALGRMLPNEAIRAQVWSNRMIRFSSWLQGSEAAQKYIPEKIRKSMLQWLIDDRTGLATAPHSSGLAKYLYTSALGLNPGAPVRNLFQQILTAGPMGVPLEEGYKNLWAGGEKYFNLRMNKGKTHDEAFLAAFPDYAASGIPTDPDISEPFSRMLSRAYDSSSSNPLSKGAKLATRVNDAMMFLFSGSEQINRIVTFEGAKVKATRDLAQSMRDNKITLPKDTQRQAILDVARQTTMETQFFSGPANMPYWLTNKSQLWRQLLAFPSRYTEYLTHTALRVGSAQNAVQSGVLKGLNPGTLARAYIWSDLAAELASGLMGIDLESATISGAMPSPSPFGAFAPLPVTPPILSLVGAPLFDFAKGDMSFAETRRQLPLLVPGGVGLSKMAGVIPGGQGVAQFINRRYVDYTKPTVDGRFPLYTPDGNLIGYITARQILAEGLGFGQMGDLAKEREAYTMLLKGRDRIRPMKRDYTMAIVNGDMAGASNIDAQFQKMFPSAGSLKQHVSEKDVENEQIRRQIPRLEKLLDTMPPEVRPEYASHLQTLMMSLGPEFLGLQPPGLTGGTTYRNRPRLPMASSQPTQQRSPYSSWTVGQGVPGALQGSMFGQ